MRKAQALVAGGAALNTWSLVYLLKAAGLEERAPVAGGEALIEQSLVAWLEGKALQAQTPFGRRSGD